MNRLLIGVGLLVLVAAAMYLLRTFDPVQAHWYPKCLLNHWTGLHCPGCGATRALHALLNGRFAAAVHYNPLLVAGLPIICLLVWGARRREAAGAVNRGVLSRWIAVLVIAFFIIRNIPTPSRSWFAPPATAARVQP